MKRELSCELQCEHCKDWFRSPIQFGYPEAFFDLASEVCTTNCPICGNRATYSRSRMRFLRRDPDGSLTVIDGKYNF